MSDELDDLAEIAAQMTMKTGRPDNRGPKNGRLLEGGVERAKRSKLANLLRSRKRRSTKPVTLPK